MYCIRYLNKMLEKIPILRIQLQQKKFPIIINYNDPVYYILRTTNGQSWNRRGSKYAKKYKIVAVRADQKIEPNCWRYTNNTKQEEKLVSELIKDIFFIEKGNKICGLIILGEIEQISNIRKSFSSAIIKKIKNRDCNKCVFCGSRHNCEVDHKDDLYITDNKVLSEEDGQLLCSQRRERVIFIAVKQKYNIVYPEKTHSNDDINLKKWISVRDAIDDLKDLPDDVKFNHVCSKHTPEMTKRMNETKYEHSAQPKYKEAYFKCHPDKPSLTVKENHGVVFVHYEKPRCMTARELARLQTFPDNFIFTGSKKDILVQIGNAIPCLLGKHIGLNIIKIFKNQQKCL